MTNIKEKIAYFESRLHRLSVNGKDNYGVRKKIERKIRILQKELDETADSTAR